MSIDFLGKGNNEKIKSASPALNLVLEKEVAFSPDIETTATRWLDKWFVTVSVHWLLLMATKKNDTKSPFISFKETAIYFLPCHVIFRWRKLFSKQKQLSLLELRISCCSAKDSRFYFSHFLPKGDHHKDAM